MSQKSIGRYYKQKAASDVADTKDFNIPANKTVMLKAFDFSCPAGNKSTVIIKLDGNVIAAAQCCKFSSIPDEEVEGPATLTIELNNSQGVNTALLGATVYYEVL